MATPKQLAKNSAALMMQKMSLYLKPTKATSMLQFHGKTEGSARLKMHAILKISSPMSVTAEEGGLLLIW